MTRRSTPEAIREQAWEFLRLYHRHEIEYDAEIPEEPVLFVGHHGFGGVLDLNVMALSRAVHARATRPVTYLVHQLAWSMRMGWLIEPLGCKPASSQNATEAFQAGRHVVVFPGGDVEAGKTFADRNQVIFGGRNGFAACALEHDVPIVPIVTAGAGESLFVINDGQALAKALGLPKALRVKALPVSLSLPWGLNIGVVGLAPYLPLPTKLRTAVLPAMRPTPGESPEQFAARVHQAMQSRLDSLVADRRWLIG